jgi:hypothetical protein
MPQYRAEHFKRGVPFQTLAKPVSHGEFVAANDAAAISEARARFGADFSDHTDRLVVSELRKGREPRLVWQIGD